MPSYWDSDLNHDHKSDLEDLAFYFQYAAVIRDSSLACVPDSIAERFQGIGSVDIQDTRGMLGSLISEYEGYIYQGTPILTHPDSLLPLSGSAREMAREHLEALKVTLPKWSDRIGGVLRQLGLTDTPPVPIDPDLNGDGYTDVADIARF
ncbi:hypothetical protein LLH00_06170, partial [bacterium]|nr:hypothetical protein [bacterium]